MQNKFTPDYKISLGPWCFIVLLYALISVSSSRLGNPSNERAYVATEWAISCVSWLADALSNSSVDNMEAYLGVDLPGSAVQVAKVVAQLVVAWVQPLSSTSAEHLSLLLCLDSLGTSGDSTSRDSGADEAIIVATAVEWD